MKNTHILFWSLTLSVTFILSGCKKEFDNPPENVIPVGMQLTLTDVKNMYTGTPVHFNGDYSTYGVITADEVSGNLYKNVYITDGVASLNLRLLSSGGLYEGDSIRLYLKGTVLSVYNGMLQLDSVDVDANVVKQSTGNVVTPTLTTIDMITAADQSKLIRLDNVQFISADTANTYADAINQTSENRYVMDCNGNQIIVRTSGYANFASNAIPNGNGSLIAIVGVYNSDIQLYVRKIGDVNMTSTVRCPEPYLDKDFEDLSITSGGWTTQQVTGVDNWGTSSFGSDNFARISNFNGTNNTACDAWLISPSINLSTATAPVLTFRSACNYTGANIIVYVSTDYVSGAPSTGTWTPLIATLSGGTWVWAASGSISLSSYLSSNVHIAFQYTGTNSDGKTWELDDILIDEP